MEVAPDTHRGLSDLSEVLYQDQAPALAVAWPAVSTQDAYRIFRSGDVETVALRGVTMSVAPGEFVALMGPSGSGKSTMLKLLAALDVPSAGDVRVGSISTVRLGDQDRSDLRARDLSIVLQSGNLWPDLTALANVELALALANDQATDIRKVAKSALAEVGLAGRQDERSGLLSGGEQQRVAIAAALGRRTPVLLADEPTGELDSSTEQVVLALLKKLRDDIGCCVVIATHSARVAAAADRIIRLHDGAIALDEETS